MRAPLARRDFLITCGVATTAAILGGPAAAIEPIQRTGKPRFKFSVAAYSYRELLGGKNKSLQVEDFIDDCAAMHLDGTELTSYYFPSGAEAKYYRDLKMRCFRLGLSVSGTAVSNDFCLPEGQKRDAEIASVKKWIDRAAILGAPVIRIFSGNAQKDQTVDDARRLAVAAIEECCAYAGEAGIYLALENHGGLTATPGGMLEVVKAVKSPWFGVNLDTGNFHGADVYADLEQLAPYAVNVQVKVVVSSAGKKKEPADFKRLAKMLTSTGYRGYIVLEFEEPGDPRKECPRYIGELREAFA